MKLLVNGAVLLTKREFDDLLEYSSSLPTGTILINSGAAFTGSLSVALTLSASFLEQIMSSAGG